MGRYSVSIQHLSKTIGGKGPLTSHRHFLSPGGFLLVYLARVPLSIHLTIDTSFRNINGSCRKHYFRFLRYNGLHTGSW